MCLQVLIGGMLAVGYEMDEAVVAGTVWHARAGDWFESQCGASLRARDLIDAFEGGGEMLSKLDIAQALDSLMAGGVIAFPTETSYGLGCRAYDGDAVARVVAAKGDRMVSPCPFCCPMLIICSSMVWIVRWRFSPNSFGPAP